MIFLWFPLVSDVGQLQVRHNVWGHVLWDGLQLCHSTNCSLPPLSRKEDGGIPVFCVHKPKGESLVGSKRQDICHQFARESSPVRDESASLTVITPENTTLDLYSVTARSWPETAEDQQSRSKRVQQHSLHFWAISGKGEVFLFLPFLLFCQTR